MLIAPNQATLFVADVAGGDIRFLYESVQRGDGAARDTFAEAVDEGQTSNSPWGPPLWIPYGAMAVGMSMLAVQTVLQCAVAIRAVKAR